MRRASEVAQLLLGGLDRTVVGYRDVKKGVVASLLAGGHVLLEGVPGVAKTTLARTLATLIGLPDGWVEHNGVRYRGWSRIQFTPDLMPADITGTMVYNPATLSFEPRPGPVFTYILLADEINRAIPRTQSALLQAMQERQVTLGDRTYPLEGDGKFFFVMATQNPVEQEGTYPLPEAQLDRFLARLIMGYPRGLEEEKEILRLHLRAGEGFWRLVTPVVRAEEVWAARREVFATPVPEEVLETLVRVVRLTRPEHGGVAREFLELGASPRAGIHVMRMAQALAVIRGAGEVGLVDVEEAMFPVLNHRLVPRHDKLVEMRLEGMGFEARYEVARKVVEDAFQRALRR